MARWEERRERLGRRVEAGREGLRRRARETAVGAQCALRSKLKQTAGQGTTEYAILVGVLVVLAIVAITLFRPKLEELWNAIAEGINGL
ncbi:Flp pilus assembly pilin Flp [Parvibacter caecicola]|uniref:Flp pilus assembly pilin Flp n=2 Tax=Parvibacter caecicola TaxID=747645 RepID=A0A3N0ACY1_9ACTN|nr:Flp pilus assembly pilin Flp [Parvibacter caecicola]RNL11658.1 hypothetical protein DMP11_02625 [Parvibacter caecicola]TJW10739.1 hypothetical protein E5982_05545 [Parvibacter caecicola]